MVVMSTLGIFVFWRDFKNPGQDVFNLNSGKSVIWLLTFYLTGAYIGKYRVDYIGFKRCIFCFIYLFIYFSLSYLYIKMNNNKSNYGKSYYMKEIVCIINKILTKRSDSLLRIAQSITVCLFFLQIHFNKHIGKIICFLGPLSFGIYLIHIHPLMNYNFLRHIFDDNPKDINLCLVIFIILMKSIKMFIFCLIIDYFRNLLFKFLRIRFLCLFLENKMNKLFD